MKKPIIVVENIYKKTFPKAYKIQVVIIFMAGVLFRTGFDMTMQDSLGLEGYINYCRDNWVYLSPAFGMVAMVLAFFASTFAYVKLFEIQKTRDNHLIKYTVDTMIKWIEKMNLGEKKQNEK